MTRRWLGLLLAVLVVGVACVELGLWQFHRYTDRHDRNRVTEAHLSADPVPVETVMSTDEPVDEDAEWTRVEATGSYDADNTVIVRYRTRDGAPGVDVVVPLVTASGTALLVDRGWVETKGSGTDVPDVPAPPAGQVTVEGWVRVNGTGDETKPADGSVRAISSTALADTVPHPLFDGFVDLVEETPSADPAPELADPPDLGSGPHFFYGLQWFFFALLAFGFWIYFARTEWLAQKRATTGEAGPGDAPGVTTPGSSRRRPGASRR